MDWRWAMSSFVLGGFLFVCAATQSVFLYVAKSKVKNGIQVTATLIRKASHHERFGEYYHDVYEWTVNGVRYEQFSESRGVEDSMCVIGEEVEAYYNPEKPDRIVTKLDAYRYKMACTFLLIGDAILMAIGFVFQYIYMQ